MNENTAIIADIPLVWDEFYWLGHVSDLGLLGKEIEIHLETEDEQKVEPHALQVDLWKRISGNQLQYLELIREGLFQYYRDIRPQYEQAGPEWIAHMPVLTRKEEIDGMLSLNYISIRWPYEDAPASAGFSYSCQWDREHGAGIIIQGNEVVDAGGADILLCS